jgi:hypothetical protein
MNQNNNNNNTPNGQVPDYRLQEMQSQMRQMAEENKRLRNTFDQMMIQQRQPAQQQQEQKSPFAPEVDSAIEQKFRALVQPIVHQTQQTIGSLIDQNDQLRFNQTYGGETYQKYSDRIERLREDRGRMGQYVSREDAYKHIYFEETNKKPQIKPEPPKAPTGPQFDPYTGRVLLSPESEQVDPNQIPQDPNQPQALQQPNQMQPNQIQQQNFQAMNPNQQYQQPMQQQQQVQQQELPPLPQASMNPSSAPMASSQGRIGNLDLETDNRNLDTWANKYGDIPL